MATEEELLSQWYEALRKEDSLRVMALLADHPSLLQVGWGEEALNFQWKAKPWKQRTALHVGVKRGNAELVEQVLILSKVRIPKHSTMKKRNPSSTSSKGQQYLKEIEQAEKSTLSASDGKSAETTGIRKALSSISRSKRAGYKSQEMARLAVAKRKRQVADSKFFVPEHPNDEDDIFLSLLLMAKDGEYNLDAIAIAALHGNRKIFLLILYAMRKCKLHDVKTESLPDFDVTEESKEDRDDREKVREITKRFFSEPTSFGASCVEKYKEHLDFNFLPWEEYLFHFLFASDLGSAKLKKEFARSLWTAVRSCSGSTWRFLLELQDGQGRTPINVVSRRTIRLFEAVVANDDGEMEAEVVESVMAPRDGAGRTALHRALAIGDAGLVSRMLLWSRFPYVDETNKFASLVRERWQHSIPHAVHAWTSTRSLLDSCVQSVDIVSRTNGFNGSSSTVWAKGTVSTTKYIAPIPCVQSSFLHTAVVHKRGSLLWKKSKDSEPKNLGEEEASLSATSKMMLSLLEESKMWEFLHKQAGVLWQTTKSPLQNRKGDKAVDQDEAEERALTLHEESEIWQHWGLDVLFPWRWVQEVDGRANLLEVDAVELAALMGDARAAKSLPLGAYNSISKLHPSRTARKRPWSALHIAANAGNSEMVKLLLDAPGCDPYIKDWTGNTALHHALNVVTIGKFEPHLLDYVSCEHLKSKDPREEFSDDDPLVDRQDCIDLLLDAGLNIFKTNKAGDRPKPQGKLSKNPQFANWWRDRKAKEVAATKSTLSSATNVTSVTAALIATASYVGPLQPPLGYAEDPSHIQDANFWVKIFIFCNTMSFYCAIVAITLSLIPAVPMPRYDWKNDVKRTQRMVAVVVAILFPSIIFVLAAFISSSIAAVSAEVTSTGGWLTVGTASIGGLACVVALFLFSVRVLAFFFPRSNH